MLNDEEEFAIFDCADLHDISDDGGNLYGILQEETDEGFELKDVGTRGEQVAKFPFARPGETWHGYPCWSIDKSGERRGRKDPKQKSPQPSKLVFQKMVALGLITEQHLGRLKNGKHA